MIATSTQGLFHHLETLVDPRSPRGQRHPFTAILATVICSTLCGSRSFRAIAEWIAEQESATWHWLGFKRTPPCANSFANLLKLIDPIEFERVISQWTRTLDGIEFDEAALQPVSIDGKTLCGTLTRHERAIHLLSAFDHQTGCVLSQCQVAPQTNEHKAALEFLKTLVLKGKVIVGDAMFCQRDLCQHVIDSGGDYFVVVKENQPQLKRDIELAFANPEVFSPLPTAPRQQQLADRQLAQ